MKKDVLLLHASIYIVLAWYWHGRPVGAFIGGPQWHLRLVALLNYLGMWFCILVTAACIWRARFGCACLLFPSQQREAHQCCVCFAPAMRYMSELNRTHMRPTRAGSCHVLRQHCWALRVRQYTSE
ncbi:hypothetical protein COO60DRAFT_528917 [Scenedesmus sp. NREL 46B-D3]|nr:hypothetical protein COO60DRAFT_528917 [Scenedesmus sp. NREL 46B-D3]